MQNIRVRSERAFVAYSSRDRNLATMIAQGVAKANRKLSALTYEPWEFNDIAGNPLISPIVEVIAERTDLALQLNGRDLLAPVNHQNVPQFRGPKDQKSVV